MHETRSRDETVEVLRRSYRDALEGLIAIDGTDGVGKTPLALGLQEVLGGIVISLDDFIQENCGGYVSYLRMSELGTALQTPSRPCIVEGVCVLAVLARLSHAADVLIYVKRLAAYGYWHDAETCDPSEPVDNLLARLASEVEAVGRFDPEQSGNVIPENEENEKPLLTPFREEIIRYHAHYRPARRADITFVNVEDA